MYRDLVVIIVANVDIIYGDRKSQNNIGMRCYRKELRDLTWYIYTISIVYLISLLFLVCIIKIISSVYNYGYSQAK